MTAVSIIIPTFHRTESLARLLETLSKTGFRQEIIVVEQAENHGKEFIQLAKKVKLNLLYYFLKQRSTPKAMNLGVAKAKGKYIIFLDDDVVPKKGFLEAHIKNFRDLKVGATVGRVITDGQEIESLHMHVGRVGPLGQVSGGFSSTIEQEVDTVIGCNTAWRKDVYQKLGGIDERFTGNALRLETDLSLRAKQLGYTLVFEPKAEVLHMRAETGGARKTEGRMQWYFDFFSNEVYFFLKHRSAILLPLFLLTKMDWALKCMLGFGREVSGRSLVTPIAGIMDGVKKYKNYWDEIAASRGSSQ